MAFTLLYITHPDRETAKRIGRDLLEKKLIACYNFLPIESAYWWQGAVAQENEVVSLLKTTQAKATDVEKAVLELHPYTTPCIMHLQVTANAAYEAWIAEAVTNSENE